jgi:hypothetical protein
MFIVFVQQRLNLNDRNVKAKQGDDTTGRIIHYNSVIFDSEICANSLQRCERIAMPMINTLQNAGYASPMPRSLRQSQIQQDVTSCTTEVAASKLLFRRIYLLSSFKPCIHSFEHGAPPFDPLFYTMSFLSV